MTMGVVTIIKKIWVFNLVTIGGFNFEMKFLGFFLLGLVTFTYQIWGFLFNGFGDHYTPFWGFF
jgi:hypothetical protein